MRQIPTASISALPAVPLPLRTLREHAMERMKGQRPTTTSTRSFPIAGAAPSEVQVANSEHERTMTIVAQTAQDAGMMIQILTVARGETLTAQGGITETAKWTMKGSTTAASAMAANHIQEANSISLGPAERNQPRPKATALPGDVVKETEISTETTQSPSGSTPSTLLSQPKPIHTRIFCSGWKR